MIFKRILIFIFIVLNLDKFSRSLLPFDDAISISSSMFLQTVIHELTEKCWDTCTESYKPSSKLDSRTESWDGFIS